jgi:hypothetical protein
MMSMTALRSAARWTSSCRDSLPHVHTAVTRPCPRRGNPGAGNPDATRASGERREAHGGPGAVCPFPRHCPFPHHTDAASPDVRCRAVSRPSGPPRERGLSRAASSSAMGFADAHKAGTQHPLRRLGPGAMSGRGGSCLGRFSSMSRYRVRSRQRLAAPAQVRLKTARISSSVCRCHPRASLPFR